MAQVVVILKVMPTGTDIDLKHIEKSAVSEITKFGGNFAKSEVKPVAFSLNSLLLYFIMEESIGSTEALESTISKIEGVNSVDVIDVRRTVG